MKKKVIIYLLAVFLISTLTACSKAKTKIPVLKKNEKVTLRCVMSSEDNYKLEAFKSFADDIKKHYPDYNITFNFVKGDKNAYETKIKVLLSSDKAPDVFLSPDQNFSNELFSEDSVMPVEKYLNSSNYWDNVIPTANVKGHNGHIYAVPFNDISYGIIEINTDLFKKNNVKIPESFDELKSAVEAFKLKGIVPIALAGKDGLAVYSMIENFACTVDPLFTTSIINGKDSFSGEPFKQAAEKVKDLIRIEAFGKKVETYSDTDAANLFYSGKAAMYCTTSSNYKDSNAKLHGKCGLAYYPSISKVKDSEFSNVITGGIKKDCGLLVSSSSEYPTEAVNLAIYMSEYYNQYLYEKKNDVQVVYIPEKLNWKPAQNIPPDLLKLMKNAETNKSAALGLFQNDIPDSVSKSIAESSSAFITNLMSVDDYIKKMDSGWKLK
jgi:raffinose/stachyose/melibiose transport system substrate-binding protein